MLVYEETITSTRLAYQTILKEEMPSDILTDLNQVMSNLEKSWDELKNESVKKFDKLTHHKEFFLWQFEVNEEQAWIAEKLKSLNLEGTRDSLSAVNRLLKKYDTFSRDLEQHNERIEMAAEQGRALVSKESNHSIEVNTLFHEYQELFILATIHFFCCC